MASNVSGFIIETTTNEYGYLADVHDCEKNPGHVGFYSLDNLTVDILPEECRTDEWLNYIRDFSKRIVRIIINKPNGTRLFETGCVYCDYYSGSDSDSVSEEFYIRTNEHVIGCQEDVGNCKIEFFFDTEDRAGIKTSYGVKLIACDKERDVCKFTVNTIPETVKQLLLQSIDTPPDTDFDNMIVISHPHGGPKTVTIGKFLGCKYVDGLYRYIHTAQTCPGSSGAAAVITRSVKLYDWRYDWYYTHYAGQHGNVYNIKKDDGTLKQVLSETNNINYSVW